jgi:hypothetical protein
MFDPFFFEKNFHPTLSYPSVMPAKDGGRPLDASFTTIELRFVACVSFPRRRESIHKWIPAFAGMTHGKKLLIQWQ